MKSWQENPKITARKGMQQENELPHNSVKTDETGVEKLSMLIGAMLTQTSLVVSLASSLDAGLQSNFHTPVMEEAMSYALWATVNHTMSTCDQVRTLVSTLPISLKSTEVEIAALDCATACTLILQDITETYFA